MHWKIIPSGRVWVDPGGSFGLVPRPLWIEHQPIDDHNRTSMDLNCLLVLSEGLTILIDTGIGHKLSEKALMNWGLEWPEGTLLENLAVQGISPEDVDIVINTHLHSDHCGGNTFYKDDRLVPTFPNAEYWVQWIDFADAYHPDARTAGTYFSENFVPLWKQGQMKFLYGDTRVTNHVQTVLTRGHTRGHQSVIIDDGTNPPVMFVSDLASYAVHFAKKAWVTAYDIEPLETIVTKTKWQEWALKNNATLIFQHDTQIRQGQLKLNTRGRFEISVLEVGSLVVDWNE